MSEGQRPPRLRALPQSERRHPYATRKSIRLDLSWGRFERVRAGAGPFSASYSCHSIVMVHSPLSGDVELNATIRTEGLFQPPVLNVFRSGDRVSGRFLQPVYYDILKFHPDYFTYVMTRELSVPGFLPVSQLQLRPTPLFSGLWRRLAAAAEAFSANPPLFETLAQILMLHVATPQHVTASAPMRGAHATAVERAVEFIDENLAKPLSLAEIARVAGVSGSHFARIFKRVTGLNPHQFVIQRRLQLAKDLLDREDMPIPQVAIACGFASQSHLTTSFRNAFGTTPGRYRKDRARRHRADRPAVCC